MSIELERNRLSQTKTLKVLKRDLSLTEMLTVYFSDSEDPHNYGIYCVLIPNSQIEQALSKLSWDLSHGEGIPAAVVYYEDGKENVEYLRYGNDSGIEPLIIDREFYGIRENYKEICEEFRLFQSLYHDRKQDHLIAIVEKNRIRIRLKEIRQFLAIKEMHLSIQFDYREHSMFSLEELVSCH